MPTPRVALPSSLASRPFTVKEARALGVSPDVLRGGAVRTPFRGVRVPADLPDTLALRCLAASLLLPGDAAFDGATAAALRELPIPRGLEPAAPVVVRVPPGTSRPQINGIRVAVGGVRVSGRPRPGTLRVVSSAQIWAHLAGEATMQLDDLVVLGDAVARRRNGLVRLREVTAASAGRRGVAAMRAALPLVRERVDSPQETRARLLLLRAGIPEPECGKDIFGDDGTAWLARPDLCWMDAKVALEYDGDTHRTDRRQWRDDIARREVLEDHGWTLVVVTADDLRHRPGTIVRRVERRLVRAGLRW